MARAWALGRRLTLSIITTGSCRVAMQAPLSGSISVIRSGHASSVSLARRAGNVRSPAVLTVLFMPKIQPCRQVIGICRPGCRQLLDRDRCDQITDKGCFGARRAGAQC